jgi:hypothetical protein
MKAFFQKNWIHFLAPALFFIATFAYFQPQFKGYALDQHDIKQYQGMANETKHFRNITGEEPLWTNSMFGGMPTYQITVDHHGNWIKKSSQALRLWLSSPAGYFFAYLIGFYIMLMCMKVNPYVAIFGSFAFAFSTYFIVILQAGHNTKAYAIGLMAPVVGAFYMAYRHNLKWGLLLSALFMGMQIGSNHFQITYYLGILLIGIGIVELIRAIKNSHLKKFFLTSAALLVAYLFALGVNYGNIALTNSYAKHTIRGGNDITITASGEEDDQQSSGLDKDYITQWSMGIGESFTLISPYVKGGGSAQIKDSPFAEDLKSPDFRREATQIGENDIYWGDQPIVSGPVYVGIIVFFLAILGMIYLKTPIKWAMLAVGILVLMLSWGKNFMGLTEFFIDNIPFYNKFRAVTIILVIIELILPLLAVLFVNKLIQHADEIKANMKPFYITLGGLAGFLLLMAFMGTGDGFLKMAESDYILSAEDNVREQLMQQDPAALKKQIGLDINNTAQVNDFVKERAAMATKQFDAVAAFRENVYQSSLFRSLLFLIVAGGFLYFYIRNQFETLVLSGGLLLLVVFDLVPVNLNYLDNSKVGRNYKHWIEKEKLQFPYYPNDADRQILEAEKQNNPLLEKEINAALKEVDSRSSSLEKYAVEFQTLNLNTNYRVFDMNGGFSSARASYFHKSFGGYHGAKLRRVQNLYNFHIERSINQEVLNMMNVKYIMRNNQVQSNPQAMGSAWLVKELNPLPHPNDEIIALGTTWKVETETNKAQLIKGVEQGNMFIINRNEDIQVNYDGKEIPLDLSLPLQINEPTVFVTDINGATNWLTKRDWEKDTTNSFTPIVSFQINKKFNAKTTAIIAEEEAQAISSLTFPATGKIELLDHKPNKIVYEVDCKESEFAVFSEVYYPDGWNAYINGEKVAIHRVNYLLRGIELPSGKYELTMRFEEPIYEMGNNIAYAGSFLLFALIIGMFVKDFLLDNRNNTAHE